MKHPHQYHHDQNQHPVNIPSPVATMETKHNGIDFGPSHQDVAKRAYNIFLNQGSLPGFDIQHWQEAEAQLVEECNCTMDRGAPKPVKN